MTEQAAIKATYADYRRVKGRKVLQLIFEVPIEKAPDVHDTFGEPSSEGATWVALALLDNEKVQDSELKAQLKASVELEKKKEPREFSTLLLSNQCALKCEEPAFWQFLNERKGQRISSIQDAETSVRRLLGVNSRAALDNHANIDERNVWLKLYDDYQTWERATR